jgi:hypothetical protein
MAEKAKSKSKRSSGRRSLKGGEGEGDLPLQDMPNSPLPDVAVPPYTSEPAEPIKNAVGGGKKKKVNMDRVRSEFMDITKRIHSFLQKY